MASDLTALQLVLQYWHSSFPGWGLSLISWVALIAANIFTVAIYGEVTQARLLSCSLSDQYTGRVLAQPFESYNNHSENPASENRLLGLLLTI